MRVPALLCAALRCVTCTAVADSRDAAFATCIDFMFRLSTCFTRVSRFTRSILCSLSFLHIPHVFSSATHRQVTCRGAAFAAFAAFTRCLQVFRYHPRPVATDEAPQRLHELPE
jgi:hypothetical protein